MNICQETFNDLVGDKIKDLGRNFKKKDSLDLSVIMFNLHNREINETTLKPILEIVLKYETCRFSARIVNYLENFFFIDFQDRTVSLQRISA